MMYSEAVFTPVVVSDSVLVLVKLSRESHAIIMHVTSLRAVAGTTSALSFTH